MDWPAPTDSDPATGSDPVTAVFVSGHQPGPESGRSIPADVVYDSGYPAASAGIVVVARASFGPGILALCPSAVSSSSRSIFCCQSEITDENEYTKAMIYSKFFFFL